jgi:predicted dehydrogenase
MKRRKFIKNSVSGAAVISAPVILNACAKGSNDRVRVAVIGIRGMGQSHIKNYSELENVEVVAICDVDENLFPGVIKNHFTDKGLKQPETYVDMRKMFEDKNIDAVSVVTPNHWHALASIWAIQAGKHVSVEKPCCYNIYEGQKLMETAKKYNVIVQDGAEQRGNPCAQTAAEFLHSGQLGEVYLAKGICYKWRDTIGNYPDGPMPEGETHPYGTFTKSYLSKVNYDLWLGPAPERPFNPNRFHYNWHWNKEYGNGDMGNQGVHELDVARWGLGVKLPTRITAMGGHLMFDDAQNTPNVLMSMFEFPNEEGKGDKKKILQFEVRHWISNREVWLGDDNSDATGYMISAANTVGNLFYGSKGYMAKNVDKWQTYMGQERELGPSGSGLANHYKNFIDTIRASDPSMLNGKIEDGVYSSTLIHLGNIAYQLGRSLEFDPATMKFKNDNEANTMISRNEYRHPFVIPDKV